MGKVHRILTINPGATSTKIAIFDNEKNLFEEVLRHSTKEIEQYKTIFNQYEFRKNIIFELLNEKGIKLKDFDAIVGRGGVLKPVEGGTYLINKNMINDLKTIGEHASNLGGIIAYEMAKEVGIPAFIVDPVVVDELEDIARISGIPQIDRGIVFHALNQKAVARRVARNMGKSYTDVNVIVAHIGGGVTIGAHKMGKVIDVNNALDGDGPFSPERSGGLPVGQLVNLCFSGEYTHDEMKKLIIGKGGLVAYLGTNDAREVGKMIKEGDKKAEFIYKAMAYQISKEIGACAAVLKGKVDAIVLTGGIAHDQNFTDWIKENVEFISKVLIYPGEDEMEALAEGGLRVLRGEEEAKKYQ